MGSVDLSTRQYDRQVVLALRGELDAADAASVVAAHAAVAAGEREIIIDLATGSSSTPAAGQRRALVAATEMMRLNQRRPAN